MSDAIKQFLQQAKESKPFSKGNFIKDDNSLNELMIFESALYLVKNDGTILEKSTDPALINEFNSLFSNTTVSKMEIDERVKAVLKKLEDDVWVNKDTLKQNEIHADRLEIKGEIEGLEIAISIIKKHFGVSE